MASGFANGEIDRILNAVINGTTYTLPTTPMKMALNSATSTNSSAGTEVTGGSYARQTAAFGTSSGATGISNTGAIIYTNMPAITTTNINVYDSNGTPRRACWGDLTASKTTGAGDTLSFAIGAVTINMT